MYFRRTEVPFVGLVLTSDGLKMQPVKGTVIASMRTPENTSAVRRFLRMANYVSHFIPKLSETVTPLRQLTRKETDWKWEAEHQQAFKKIQSCLIEPPVLRFFDSELQTKLQCDASSQGLGGVLIQDGQPVAYSSRALTKTEKHYAQIEKELQSVVFGLENFTCTHTDGASG